MVLELTKPWSIKFWYAKLDRKSRSEPTRDPADMLYDFLRPGTSLTFMLEPWKPEVVMGFKDSGW